MLWEKGAIAGFFWWWWGIILFVCFPKPVGKASPCKCAASLLWAPISPSGTLPGDTDEILGLPLDCTKCPWNCQVRRKGAVQEVTDSKTLKDQPKSMTLTVPIPVPMKQETHLTPFNNQRWSAQILKVYQLFLHKHWQNHPQLISSKHFWDSCHMKTFGSFLLVLDDWFFFPFLYDDVVYLICSMGSLPFHWRAYFKYQQRLVF